MVKLKEWESACMEVYAAMVDNMDQGIGRIVKALEEAEPARQHAHHVLPRQRWLRGEALAAGKLVGPLERPEKPTLAPDEAKDELQTQMVPPQEP